MSGATTPGRTYLAAACVNESDHLRKLPVSCGQEVLTSDNVVFKASLLVIYQLNDPAKAAPQMQNWWALYNAAQIALRAVAGA